MDDQREEIQSLSFEDAMARLDDAVAALEAGELSLEESVALYKNGVALSRLCREKLAAASHAIEILAKEDAAPPDAPTAHDAPAARKAKAHPGETLSEPDLLTPQEDA